MEFDRGEELLISFSCTADQESSYQRSHLQWVLDYAAYRWDNDGTHDVMMKMLGKANLSGIVTVQSIHSDTPKIVNGETQDWRIYGYRPR